MPKNVASHYTVQGPLYKWTEHSQNFIFWILKSSLEDLSNVESKKFLSLLELGF